MRNRPASPARGVWLLLVFALSGQAHNVFAQADVPAEYISVGDYSGAANERIDAAIAAAMATDHKTVFFPNGTYALRSTLSLNRGSNTELHLIGESQDGVFLVPDVPYLEANYNGGDWENGGARIAHMINLSGGSVFDSVDVSIQNMTVDMRSQLVNSQPQTYNVVGHGIRVGQGWDEGQFTVNHVTIRNTGSYGVGIQDRGGHPKNNITLTNLEIERTGSDGIDTKEASGDGNRNLVIRNVSVNEIGFLDTGAANAIDVRYRNTIIENVHLVSEPSRSTLPGQTSSNVGINFRPNGGTIEATVSGVYSRGFKNAFTVQSSEETAHQNIDFNDFKLHGYYNNGIRIAGPNNSGHLVSNGYVFSDRGNATVSSEGGAFVSNVIEDRWNPAFTPVTNTTVEGNVSLAADTFSPAWTGIVGAERLSLNPTVPGPSQFSFDVTNTGLLQVDYDAVYNAMDKLIIDGALNLGGELLVNLIDGVPTTSGTFQILQAETITGAFDTVTLPAAGGGLRWNTDSLAIDGTISLLEVPAVFLGDLNTSYSASSAEDNPPVDAAFQADLATISASWTFKGLDEGGRNDVRAMTFEFDALDADDLDSVLIEARVNGLNGYENDNMVLDFVGNNRRLDSMTGFAEGGGWMTLQYELDPSEFSLLSDGQLNLAFVDDTQVDWVELSWVLASDVSSGLPGDFNNDGIVDGSDYTVWRDNLGSADETALNGNGSGAGGVDAADYELWRQNFGATAAAGTAATVPEPSALLLAMLGLTALRTSRAAGNCVHG